MDPINQRPKMEPIDQQPKVKPMDQRLKVDPMDWQPKEVIVIGIQPTSKEKDYVKMLAVLMVFVIEMKEGWA